MAEEIFEAGGRNTQARCVPARIWRDAERASGILLYELGAGHQALYTPGSDSHRRENVARDGDQEPLQGRDGGKRNAPCKRLGDGKPSGICPGADGGKKQRDNRDTFAIGTDSDKRMHNHDRRYGLPA